jgi:hypothetical protein
MGVAEPDFPSLIVEDTELNTLYRRALEARALVVMEGVFAMADDDSKDTIDNGIKGEIPNMAAVTRSKLKVETRTRVAGMWNTKLYGEKKDNVNVQVNINHAERLEEARNRAQLREKRVTPKQLQGAIDAAFTAPDDTSWMDDKPADAVWREET